MIKTLQQLKKAPKETVLEAKESIKLLEDLKTYFLWVKSPKGIPVEGTFKLGYFKRSLGIHPSTLSKEDFCKLRVYFEVTGEVLPDKQGDPDKFLREQLTFDSGTLIHIMFQSFFKDMYGTRFQDEVPLLNEELRITSHADGILELKNVKTVLEIKSIKEGGSFGVETVRNKPMTDHVRQAHFYMATSNTPFCNIFYFCKNTSEIIEHVISFRPSLWRKLKTQVKDILLFVDQKKKPTANTGYHCRSCVFLHGCDKGLDHVWKRRQAKRRSY